MRLVNRPHSTEGDTEPKSGGWVTQGHTAGIRSCPPAPQFATFHLTSLAHLSARPGALSVAGGDTEGHGEPGWGGGWARCLHQGGGGRRNCPSCVRTLWGTSLFFLRALGTPLNGCPGSLLPNCWAHRLFPALLSQAGPQRLPLSYIPLHMAMGRRNPPRALRGPTRRMLGLTLGGRVVSRRAPRQRWTQTVPPEPAGSQVWIPRRDCPGNPTGFPFTRSFV